MSCRFTQRLIAKKGNTLYFEHATYSEFYDQGPVLYQQSYIMTMGYNEQNGTDKFEYRWINYSTLLSA